MDETLEKDDREFGAAQGDEALSPPESIAGARAGKGAARARLVDAAGRLFAEKGFYGTSIRDIAGALGLTKAAVMYHFASKEALYGAVLERLAAALAEVTDAVAAAPGGTAEELETLIDEYLAWALGAPRYAHLMLRELLDNAGRAVSAERWYLAGFVNGCAALIVRGQREGLLAAGHPVAMLECLLAVPAYHLAAGPTRRRILGDAASDQADAAFYDEACALVRRAWGYMEECAE